MSIASLSTERLLLRPFELSDAPAFHALVSDPRVLRYTGEQADIDLALRTNTGQLFGATVFLSWAEGDWKARMADDGSDLTSISPITDLSGYVAWSADGGQ